MEPKFFEDLRVGMEFRSALSKPLRTWRLVLYALLTGDRLHKKNLSPGKGRVVQGNFVVAVTGGVLFAVGHFNETLLAQSRKFTWFKKPVYAGERIYAVEEVTALEDVADKKYGKVTLERRTYNERDELVQQTEQEYLVLKRTKEPGG